MAVGLFFLLTNYWPSISGIFRAKMPSDRPIENITDNTSRDLPPPQNKTNLPLTIPDGYSLSIYAKDLINPRDLILDSKGTLLTSITGKGKVVALVEGKAKTVLGDLNKPHGLAFDGDRLFVAETDRVSVYDYSPLTQSVTNARKIIDLPGGSAHFTRSILIHSNKLYVSTGSSCNACEEKDGRRAAVWFSNLDGSDFRPYATGLRNAVFMTVKPGTNEIWATNMGRDNLGDDIPPETVVILKEAKHYGWPYCYGNRLTDAEINKNNSKFDCSKTEPPILQFQAHSAPLGLDFLGTDLLVAYHGSWNRSVPTGYKVVKFANGTEQDFITGWYSDGEVWGRPADILVKKDTGEIFISDDKAGAIYKLTKI